MTKTPSAGPQEAGPAHAPVARRRIPGLDAARALAVAGMVSVHVAPPAVDVGTPAGWLYELPHGRAALLFVLLAGVGVSLLDERRRGGAVVPALLVRAGVFLPLGLALQATGTHVAVILHYYAAYYLVAVGLRQLGDRTLLATSLAWSVLGPLVFHLGRERSPDWFDRSLLPGADEPLALVRSILLSGYYPVVVWGAALAWGIWLGRCDLSDTVLRRRLVLGGAAVGSAAYLGAWRLGEAGVGGQTPWAQLAVAEPHAGTPLWLIGGTAAATAVLALCLVTADRWRRAVWPLVAMGQLALTVYAGHLLFLVTVDEALPAETLGGATVATLALVAAAVVLSVLWRAVLPRGPLEGLVAALSRRAERPARAAPPPRH